MLGVAACDGRPNATLLVSSESLKYPMCAFSLFQYTLRVSAKSRLMKFRQSRNKSASGSGTSSGSGSASGSNKVGASRVLV